MKTNREVVVQFGGGKYPYPVTVPKGTPIALMRDGRGEPLYVVVNPSVCRSGYAALFKHDSIHRYVYVPADAVDKNG